MLDCLRAIILKNFLQNECYSGDVCAEVLIRSDQVMFQIAFEYGCFIATVNFCFDHETVKRSSN